MGVLSRLFGSLGDHDRLAQRHTKECKLLKSTLKPFARSFFTQVSKRWFFSLRSGGNHCWKPLYFWQFSFLLCANEVDVFVFSHNIKAKSLLWSSINEEVLCNNKGKNGRNLLRLMSVFNVYNHVYCETWFKFFLPLRQFIAWSRRKKDSNSKSSPSLNTISLLIMQLSMLCPREGGGGLRDRVGTIPWDKICICKLSDGNPERTQPKLFPHW